MRVERQTATDHRSRRVGHDLWPGLLGLALGLVLGLGLARLIDPAMAVSPSTASRLSLRQRWAAFRVRSQFPVLSLDLDLLDLQQLQSGAFAPDDNSNTDACVPATASLGDLSADVTLCPHQAAWRIDEGATPTFELQVDEGEQSLGMVRARFMPAGPDAALVEGYFRSLADIGLPVPDYDVVKLTVNGSRWGFYAMEELRTISDVPLDPGIPAVAFDALDGGHFADGLGSGFARAEIREGYLPGGDVPPLGPAVATDSAQMSAASRATANLRAVLRGRGNPAAVVDADRLGQMMALTALWRGCLAPDWRAVQFAYDASTARFIPLALGLPQDATMSLPAQLYDDLGIQEAYVRALQAYSDPDYSRSIVDALGLEARYFALSEGLGRGSTLDMILAENQARMRRLLGSSPTLRARYWQELDTLYVEIEAIAPIPVVVMGLEFGAQGYLPLDAAWVVSGDDMAFLITETGMVVPPRTTDSPSFLNLNIPRTDLPALASTNRVELSLVTHILGMEERVIVTIDEASSDRDVRDQ